MSKYRDTFFHCAVAKLALALCALLAAQMLRAQTSNTVPLVDQPLVPMSAEPGGAGFTLTVNGTGFVPGSTVMWNGKPRSTNFISDTRITAQIPASDIAIEATAWVTVNNPPPGGGNSNVSYFSVTAPTSTVFLARRDLPVVCDGLPSSCGGDLAVGDFNNDGILDIVVASFNPLVLSVYFGNGDGTFQNPVVTSIPVSPQPDYMLLLVGDFNGDSRTDVLVGLGDIYKIGPKVLSFIGNGNGTFKAPLTTSMPTGYFAPWTAADLNGDGNLDLIGVVASSYMEPLAVSFGNGDGTFQPPVSYPGLSQPAQSAVVGDFNRDGKLDIAVATTSENNIAPGLVYVFLGAGNGLFDAPRPIGVPPNPIWIVSGDFNGDGKPDLATTNSQSNTVSVLLGNGDGTFQVAINYDVGIDPDWITLADFNGDGNLDIATTNGQSQDVSILLGSGLGTFQARSDYALPSNPNGLVAGDLDGSGRQGLLVNLPNAAIVSILLQPTTYLIVSIDVKPGDASNTINLKSSGLVPVAILGSATFDPMTVDPTTVTFAGAPVASQSDAGHRPALQRDVNNDGYPDLVLFFRTQDLTALQPPSTPDSRPPTPDSQSVEAVLYGTTYGGQKIRGSDTVRIVPGSTASPRSGPRTGPQSSPSRGAATNTAPQKFNPRGR